ncbi:DUF881 domain-containing protein [[Clostridium] leptum]|uniref:DUF881 domain-containing protein n=2 Tax=Solibaculum mannosilyticum TaxID=2780922 RepID=A0A7I8D4D5_9FIRM|nr:DUF881 domain-containing protein [Solibaculum mannosilyticum]MCO7136346.1 DUF881 domain-containing protein [[Clostridium] leptum]BCI60895.1 hypothetical protein C12CBH8_15340 [Solibaculum mannosilyticum]
MQTNPKEDKPLTKPAHRMAMVLALMLVLMVVGFLVTLQIRSVSQNKITQNAADHNRTETMQQDLNDALQKVDDLQTQLARARADLEDLRKACGDSDDTAKVLEEQLETAERLAGLTELSGPGIVVTIQDKTQVGEDAEENPEKYMVHEEDLLRIVNELFASSAEALSINDERMVATSEIRCAGTTVSINNKRYGPPFVIQAIGDPAVLEYALTMRGGIVDVLSPYIDITVEKKDNIVIPAYHGDTELALAD